MRQITENFVLRSYDKIELARLYSPGRSDGAALQTLYRWINQCQPLKQALQSKGYHPHRKRYLRSEVEQIVAYLGEP